MSFAQFSILARRVSPLPLASIAVTAQASSMKSNARKKKRKKGDVNKRCKQQAEEWGASISPMCPGNALCEEILACGTAALSRCDFGTFLDCLFGGFEDPADTAPLS